MTAQRSSAFLLFAVAAWLGGAPAPARAQPDFAFGAPSARDLVLPQFADREVAALLAALDSAIVGQQPALSVDGAGHTLWNFAKRLQAGRLSLSQESSVIDHLEQLGQAHPAYRDSIARASFMVRALTVGKTAPEMTGQDLAGRPVRLSEYRGRVLLVTFSADWCAICRSQHPYFRLMQELWANWPFAILGVETGEREAAQRLKAEHGLAFRSVWDGPDGDARRGPIATAWNVLGWPTTYVLDADGVIRFVDLRDEDLLKGVRQLLAEHVDRADAAARRQRQ